MLFIPGCIGTFENMVGGYFALTGWIGEQAIDSAISFGKLEDLSVALELTVQDEALPTTAVEIVAAVLAKLEASWLGSQSDW